MSETAERPTLDAPERQWVIVEVDVREAERGADAVGPFTDQRQAQLYADLTNRHGSFQPSVIPLIDEPRLRPPAPEPLAEANACLQLEQRLNQVGDDSYPRIHGGAHGYTVSLGFGPENVQYAVTSEGEHMRLPAQGPTMAIRSYQLTELPAPVRERVVALAEAHAGVAEQALEL